MHGAAGCVHNLIWKHVYRWEVTPLGGVALLNFTAVGIPPAASCRGWHMFADATPICRACQAAQDSWDRLRIKTIGSEHGCLCRPPDSCSHLEAGQFDMHSAEIDRGDTASDFEISPNSFAKHALQVLQHLMVVCVGPAGSGRQHGRC